MEILKCWENSTNGKIKRELKKMANEDINEIGFVSARVRNHYVSGATVQECCKKVM
jgi:hypothetical protein